MSKYIITISGQARSGKDTLALYLLRRLKTMFNEKGIIAYSKKEAFANPVKDSLSNLFGSLLYYYDNEKKTESNILDSNYKDNSFILFDENKLMVNLGEGGIKILKSTKEVVTSDFLIKNNITLNEIISQNKKVAISIRDLIIYFAECVIKKSFGEKIFTNKSIDFIKEDFIRINEKYKLDKTNPIIYLFSDLRFEQEVDAILDMSDYKKIHIHIDKQTDVKNYCERNIIDYVKEKKQNFDLILNFNNDINFNTNSLEFNKKVDEFTLNVFNFITNG